MDTLGQRLQRYSRPLHALKQEGIFATQPVVKRDGYHIIIECGDKLILTEDQARLIYRDLAKVLGASE